jgi:hypothetical protein
MYNNRIEKFIVEGNALNLTNGESYNVSTFITDINIRKDFIGSSFPLVVVNMMTTDEYRNIMRDNDISLKIKVSKYIDVNDENTQDTSDIVIDEVVLDTLIRSYKKPFTTGNIRTEDEDEAENNSRDTTKLIPYQIVGIPENLVRKNSIVINEVYANAKMDDIVANILSKVDSGRIFMDPSDNLEREESLIIPPMNVIPAMRYLQEVYGIYNAGLSVFFDFDSSYVIKTYSDSREYTNTFEVLSTDINDNTTGVKYTTPQFDEEGNVRMYMQNPPVFTSIDVINSDVLGQTAVFNSYNFDFENVRRIYNNDDSIHEKTRYFWNQFQNKIHEESFINENRKTGKGISLVLKSVSPTYFSLSTLYRVSTNSSYVNGDYIPLTMTYSFFTRDYKSYDSLIAMTLTKK